MYIEKLTKEAMFAKFVIAKLLYLAKKITYFLAILYLYFNI